MWYFLLLACSHNATPKSGPLPAESPPAPEPVFPKATAPEVSISGSYTQPSCGERAFVRNLTLRDDGSLELEDLVSPCPDGQVCMWSGVVVRQGSYTLSSDVVTLTLKGDPRADGAAGPPSTLRVSGDELLGECPWKLVP